MNRKEKDASPEGLAARVEPATGGLTAACICVVLAALVFAVFGRTLGYGFVNYDDNLYVYDNPQVSGGITPGAIEWAFTHFVVGHWAPLTTLSHMLDCQVYGLKPWGHHLTNVLLHAAATILLFLVLQGMTGARWRSAFVAAVFAIHPLHVESVAWVSERKDVLSAVFFMLTLAAYVHYTRRPGAPRYLAALFLFAPGLMAKDMLVTLPFVLLLLDYWPLGRFAQPGAPSVSMRLILEKAPFFLLALAAGAVQVVAIKGIVPAEQISLPAQISNALVSCASYVGQMIYPAGLAISYPDPGNRLPAGAAILALTLLVCISACAFIWRRRYPYFAVGWLWYLGMLVPPVIGFVRIGHAQADRYTYLPQIGLYIAIAWLSADFCARWRHGNIAAWGTAVAVLSAFMVIAIRQVSYWRNSETLWTRALDHSENNAIAHNNLGNALDLEGKTREAVVQFREALRLNPAYAEAHGNLGNSLLKQKSRDEAVSQFRDALRIDPNFADAHNNLGLTLYEMGQKEEAVKEYREALRANPNHVAAHNNLGSALAGQGLTEDAIVQYRAALQADPGYANAHNNLGLALVQQGRMQDAIAQFREALRIKPDYADAHNNLGTALGRQGNTEEAVAQWRESLVINPNQPAAHYNLGMALALQGRTDEAIAHYREAVRINPDYATAYYNLGNALLQQGHLDEAVTQWREALRIKPDYADARYNLGKALLQMGQTQEAIAQTQRALELQPDDTDIENNLAWMLATASPTSLRDAARALELATKASKASGDNDPVALDTLAAAYAGTGQFAQAVQTAKKALQLAEAKSDSSLAGALRREIKLYEAGLPFQDGL